MKTPKINFKNRDNRRDKRVKNSYPENPQGDFHLLMSQFDNSTGDYNYLVFDFLNNHVPECREKFQKFLQDWLNDLYEENEFDNISDEI
jgi:hypothetical protein